MVGAEFVVGNAVTYLSAPGIGRVGELDGARVRIDFFESSAEPVAEFVWCDLADVNRVPLGEQTRVFFQDAKRRWRSGRVVGGGPDTYFVRVPNLKRDVDIDESRLRVRWEKPPRDPMQVLLSGANETPRFRDAREPVRRLLLAERAASASASGIVSAGVSIHAHQINAALRIIRDPVQRYLLADEVGMGKTIQAGFVMRQLLLDAPGRTIGIVVPDALIAQWRSEMLAKFYLDDFPTTSGELPFRILGHGDVDRWHELSDVDLLVVDEAHLLARTTGPSVSPYKEIAALAHIAPRILMLSATPFSRSTTTHLALLHLLDPQLFRWDDQDAFDDLLHARHQLALAVFGLDEEPDPGNPGLLELQFDEIRQLVPRDETLNLAMERATRLILEQVNIPESADLEQLRRAVAAVRTHVSETYRLHHRVIRNRRHMVDKQRLDDQGLLTPFEFTGRNRPKLVRLRTEETSAGARAVAEWATRCAGEILDNELDARPYGQALGVLVSRLGGPVEDLCSVLDYRINARDDVPLSVEEKEILNLAPALPFETAVLDDLNLATSTDGLDALVDAIAQRCHPTQRAIVFCGRGPLATNLTAKLGCHPEVKHAYSHVDDESDGPKEEATNKWRINRGILVVDDTGEVGRNFQEADVAFHVRVPWNPNKLEQRIGRVDRYGHHKAAQQFVIADSDLEGILTAWLKLLASGFRIFTESISTLQEAVDGLTEELWTSVLTDGVEGFLEREAVILEVMRKEKRRINELDALEASYGTQIDGETMALAIASYEEDASSLERSFTQLIRGEEGFRFQSMANMDGSVRFQRGVEDKPLLSPRLLGRLDTVPEARTGYFDRWKLKPGRRIFRRGNPFIDGMETLLNLDDRGQAVAMWRLNRTWPDDPMTFFGFDFLVEADSSPMIELLRGQSEIEPIARRRADAAFAPQHQRIWIPAHTRVPVEDQRLAQYLSSPYVKGRDVNLNFDRIGALHALLGGEENLALVADGCFAAATGQVPVIAGVEAASRRAVEQVRRDTEIVLAQSRARSQAGALVSDPSALDAEVALGHALEAGVATPRHRLTTVSCVVVAANSWADYV
jgi:ATP-dependent helicase HepA